MVSGRAGLDPYLLIPVVVGATFLLGVALYRVLVRHLPRGPAGGPASLLLLFGVWLVLRNVAYLRHRYWRVDTLKAERDYGYMARHRLADGLTLTARWYVDQGLL